MLLFIIGVATILTAIIWSLNNPLFKKGIWLSGTGTVMTVLSLMFAAGYNNTPYYPSVSDIQSSLTIYNSSSSLFTLQVMSVVSLLIPVVLFYIIAEWRAMDKKPITATEIIEGGAKY